jgi:Uma2 family endonuclease
MLARNYPISDNSLVVLLKPQREIDTLDTPTIEEEEDPLESDWHVSAMTLLINILRYWWRDRQDIYVSGNTTVYFDPAQLKKRNFRGPDVYVVKDVPKMPRRSWVVWQEDDYTPDFIIELASPSTAQFDLKEKKDIYERHLQTKEYVVYNPDNQKLQGWRLSAGRYKAMVPNDQGWLWCEELELWLGLGAYDFLDGAGPIETLRFFDPQGQLLPTRDEAQGQRAKLAEQQAEVETRALYAATAEIARLKALLAKKR